MTKTVFLAGILLLWPGLVWADLVGTYDLTEGDMMVVEYHDENNFRINMGSEGYVLMHQGKAYIVSKQNGEWEAMSVESMKAMMSQMGFGQQVEQTIADRTPPTFEDTGRTERHAGITGKVYRVTMKKADGTEDTAEMVFGEDPRLLTLQEANIRVAEAWQNKGRSRQGPSFGEIMKKYQSHGPGGGILRYDDGMRLVSLQETELAPSRFALPQVKEMKFPAGMMPPQGQAQIPTQNPVVATPPPPAPPQQDGRVTKGAKRIGDRAAKKTEDTIGKNVEDGVQKGVDSFIKGIFGD
jgi:hypothetical protein